MRTKSAVGLLVLLIAVLGFNVFAAAGTSKDIKLPEPRISGGRPLMQVLAERSSRREFSSRKLPLQVISDMLWAGSGISRPESGKRTAPSAMNLQEIDIYLALPEGVYRYNARENILESVLEEDIRRDTGKQDFVKDAAINLIYVADLSKTEKLGERRDLYAAMDTGFIAENVYLFCASEGLATVVRGLFDQETLSKRMKLRPNQRIILTQSVGYPDLKSIKR